MALVCLHGLGTGPEAWEPQIAALGDGRETFAPPLRLERGFTFEGEADRLYGELPTEPFDLCGLSLGALLALRMALDRPERVRRLVLCAGFASLPRRFRVLQAVVGTIAAFLPAGARGELGDVDRRGLLSVYGASRGFDVRDQLGRLTMPALVLVGEEDRPNLGLSKALAASLPDARLEVVPGAGHVANVDAPEAFTALLRAFLDAGDPQP